MSVIAVTEDRFSGGETFAVALAKHLDFLCLTPAALIDRATAWGADPEKLRKVVENPPRLLGRLTVNNYTHLRVLRGMLGEEIRRRSAVCLGAVADLLPEAPEILRIRVRASHASRLRAAQSTKKVDSAEATRYLKDIDRRQRRWHTYVHGRAETASFGRFDLVVNTEDMALDEFCRMVETMIAQRTAGEEEPSAALGNFILASRIQAELALDPATAHLETQVQAFDGMVTLHGLVRGADELNAVKMVTALVRGVKQVDSSKVRLGDTDFPISFAGTPSYGPGRPWFRPAYALASVGAVAALSFVLIEAGRSKQESWPVVVQTPQGRFAGIITDTLCTGGHHIAQQTAECVRACVRHQGVKYALYDGSRTYVVNDQAAAERLAGKNVIVKGTVDQNTSTLLVDSIQAR